MHPPTPQRRAALARITTSLAPVDGSGLLRTPVVVEAPHIQNTGRLLLRPLRETDRNTYINLLRSCRDHLARHLPLHRAGESDAALFERHLAYSMGALHTGLAWRRIICLHDGAIIGGVNLNDITTGEDGRSHAEINCWLAPGHTSRGLGLEAAQAALAHAFAPAPPRGTGLDLASVYGYIAPDNEVSHRLVRRLGFIPASDAAPVQLNFAGRWVTHHVIVRHAPAAARPSIPTPSITTRRLLAAKLARAAQTPAS